MTAPVTRGSVQAADHAAVDEQAPAGDDALAGGGGAATFMRPSYAVRECPESLRRIWLVPTAARR
jgi:hypothetical protein